MRNGRHSDCYVFLCHTRNKRHLFVIPVMVSIHEGIPEIKLVKQAILSESTHNSPVNCNVNSCTNKNRKTVKRDIPIYPQNQRSSRMVRLAATCMCSFAIENTVKVVSD